MRSGLRLLVYALSVLLLGAIACRDEVRPITSAAELQIQQIYDAAQWLRRIPVDLAVSLYARSKVESFVEELDLPEEVRARVLGRVQADDFVDELVPFLLFVREMYAAPDDETIGDFDAHLRAHFRPGDGIPGIEHSMFRWAAAEKASGSLALSPELARELVVFYDVLYLRDHAGARSVEDRLACESRTLEQGLKETTVEAAPAIRALLTALRSQLDLEGDLGAAVQGILDDDSRLEAATAALIQFIDQTVCRNYRFFATRVFRAKQLADWMRAEFAKPGGGALWAFLEHANQKRHYGVLVVVDGLQGRLVEALAAGRGNHPFLQAIAAEQAAAGGPAPQARSLRNPEAQQTQFLEHIARHGFAHPHYLPFFRGLLASDQAHWVPVGVSTTPTISVRNIPIAQTGAPVAGEGSTGLPNFHFVDREYRKDGERRGRGYYFFGSDAVALTAITQRAGMRTLFERMPHLGSFSCTAQYDDHAHSGIDAFLNLGLGEKLRDFGDRLCVAELEHRSRAERELARHRAQFLAKRRTLTSQPAWYRIEKRFEQSQERSLAERLIDQIAEDEQRTLPELLVYYYPWPDHFAHFEGPFADEIVSPSGELNRLDYWLGRFRAAYAAAGVLDRTVFGMAGDHGLAPVFHLLNPEVEIFDALREEGTDFRVVKISSDEGEGPKLTNPFDPPPMTGIDVVVASTAGGNYMLDLFVDQDEGFAEQPLARQLRSLRPLDSPQGTPIDLLDEIAARLSDSLDYLVVREEPCDVDGGAVRVVGERRGVRSEAVIRRRGDRLHYTYQGADLLDTDQLTPYETLSDADRDEHARLRARCLAAAVERPEAWCSEAEWRRLTSYTLRPDSAAQLAHLYDADRAGTVNLFPRSGVGYNTKVPGRHAGESFHEKNAFVGLWGEPLARRDSRPASRSVVNGAVPMGIFEFLSGERPQTGTDGWGYTPFPRGLFRSQSGPSDEGAARGG